MDMARFMEMLDDFDKTPTLAAVARTQVLLPGDKGYKSSEKKSSQISIDQLIGPNKVKEPEWMRQARLKRERRAGEKVGG